MGNVIDFPPRPMPTRVQKLADNLWMYQMSDTPEAQAAADKLVAELRERNYIVPEYMKGPEGA